MQYDVATKVVVEHGKEAILRWFLKIEPEGVEIIEELPQETVSLRRSDFPLWVRTKNGREQIVLLGFQTRWEWEVPLRLLEYVVRFRLKYRLPVVGVVVLFARRERLERREKADLLTALTIFSGFKGENVVRELLKRRRDIMIESPAYEIIKEEGIREGLQQGMVEEAREMVLEALSFRFGVVPVETAEEIKSIEVREVLKQLLRAAMGAESLNGFREQLRKAVG